MASDDSPRMRREAELSSRNQTAREAAGSLRARAASESSDITSVDGRRATAQIRTRFRRDAARVPRCAIVRRERQTDQFYSLICRRRSPSAVLWKGANSEGRTSFALSLRRILNLSLRSDVALPGTRLQPPLGDSDVDLVHLAVAFRRSEAEEVLTVQLVGDLRKSGAEVLRQSESPCSRRPSAPRCARDPGRADRLSASPGGHRGRCPASSASCFGCAGRWCKPSRHRCARAR